MLVFDDTSFTIEGVTVFSDHANPDLFWYLPPTAPQIGTRGPDDLPNFALNTFRPAAADDATRGGGFLTIETVLPLKRETRQRIMARLNTLAEGRPSLSPVPMDTGTVRIVAVDLEGSGGTTNTNAGDLKFVERIFGATKPSMAGDQNAVFNLQLSQEGAVFLKKVFEAGSSNVGVVYDFEYTGLRPALDVEITTNFKRVYDHFSMHLGLDVGGTTKGVKLTLKADIDRVFDKLVQDGVIQVKVINFSSAADAAEKEKWAFDFFKDKLLTEWFTPTFSAVTTAGGDNSQSGGTTSPTTSASTPATQPASSNPSSTTTTQPASTPSSSAPSTGTATPVPANPVMPSPGGTAVERPASEVIVVENATLAHSEAFEVIENFEPAQLTKSIRGGSAGRDVTLTSLLDSAEATLQFTGPGRPATVTVGGQELALDGAGRVNFDAPAGRTIQFTARYPATAASTDTFRLMFDHDKPPVAGFTVTPPSALYTAYLNGSSTTRDSAFLTTRGSGPEQSAAALRAWVAQSTSPVAIHAHASFEGDASLGDWNQRLTERRLAVAQGIVGSTVPITTATAHGFDAARSANRLRSPADRVAILTRSGDAGPETVIEGTVTRPAATPGETPGRPNPGQPSNPGGDAPANPDGDRPTTPGGDTPTTPGGDTPTSPAGDTPASPGGDTPASPGTNDDDDKKTPLISGPFHATLTFKLKSVTQIEDKSLTLRYNRQEAVKRTHAPQGPLFLMAQGLQGPPFFVDVDLNSTFFRKLDITIDNPLDYDAIGLTATDVELEYGDLAHPQEVLRHDVRFRHDGEKTAGHKFFLNEDLDLTYRVRNEFHFDAASGWEGSALSYELPTVETADRTLLVNPHQQLGFMTITVMPGEIDAELMRHTTVRLSYQGTGWSREKVLLVEHDTPPTDWKLRLNPGDPRLYTYRLTHHLRDGTTRDVGPVETDLTTLLVDDPFENPLTVEFLPNFDPATAQTVFVQVTYSDPANNYERLFDLTFDSASLARQRLRIARINTDLGTFTYQITAMAADHSVTRFAPITTEDRFVFLGETLN